jgi:tetratricopeptide (TPR) repeat protein
MKKHTMSRSIIFILIFLQFIFVSFSNSANAEKVKKQTKTTTQKEGELTEQQKIEFEYYFIEGLKQKMMGNPDIAIQQFNRCYSIDSKSAAVLYELAKIHVIKGDFMSAQPLLNNAIVINPENKWYYLLLAQIYQNNKQYVEASKVYANLIKINPDNLDYYYLNAMNLTSGEKYDEALKAYKQLEEKFGFSEQISLARQQLYRSAGKNKEAYQEIERLIKFNPTVPEYYGLMADMYKEDGNMKKALELYSKVLEIEPSNGFVQFSLATYYIQNKELDKAFSHAQSGFSNPEIEIETKIQLYLMLITASTEQKLSDQQIEELVKQLILTHPNDSRSYSIQADFFIQRSRFQEARENIKKSLDIDPNSYSLWEQLILIDNQNNDSENMKNDCEKALELFPSQPQLYVLHSISLIQIKDYEKALQTLDSGQTYILDNKKLEAQFELYRAEAYYNLNNSVKAFSSFDKVIEMEPDNYVAMNNYAYYLSVKGEQLEKAEIMSSRVIQANPENPTYIDTYAWVLFKRKDYKLAKYQMEIAIKFGGNLNDVIVEHYGDILFMLNDVEGAVANWIKSKELGNQSKILQQKIDEKRFIEGDE